MKGLYQVQYIDPPWFYRERGFAKGGVAQGSASDQFECMSFEELVAFGGLVNEYADPEGTAVFLWTTRTHTDVMIDVGRAWGLRYVCKAFTWVKVYKAVNAEQGTMFDPLAHVQDGRRVGMGWHSKATTEDLHLWKRGKPGAFDARDIHEVHHEPIREHSRKPDIFRKEIERAYPEARRLEAFARTSPEGWDVLGNEIDRFRER